MKYAIIESGGKQFKAVEGVPIEVDRLPVEAGATVKLEQVLLLADGENVTVGTPFIKDFIVWAKALDHIKGPKVTVFKYRPKKRIRVKAGHRQNYTRLMIEQIGGSSLVVKPKVEESQPEEAVALAADAAVVSKAALKKSTEKPAAKAAPKKSTEKPAAKAAPKKSTEKPAAKAAPKKSTEKPAAKAAPKKSTEKPAAKAAPKKSTEKSAAKPAEKKSSKPAEKKAD
ncbi:MAG: 50S ribosomal protein L21 [Anaerolineales bacterium]|nr:50S ribosomal protein L21 [Anaerolineales bacterium]